MIWINSVCKLPRDRGVSMISVTPCYQKKNRDESAFIVRFSSYHSDRYEPGQAVTWTITKRKKHYQAKKSGNQYRFKPTIF